MRSSIAHLEQPDAITEVLGRRPSPGASARTWDGAAGRLAQHQAAFNIAEGIGPHPRWDSDNAYTRSYQTLAEAILVTRPTLARRIEIERPGVEF